MTIHVRSTMGVELIDIMGNDLRVAMAARVSTARDQGEQTGIEGLIRYLARNKHMSPFEHCSATFRLDVPLFVRDQIVRHRTFCLTGDSVISFSRPCDGRHYQYELKRLYKNWSDPAQRARLRTMRIRSVDESTGRIVDNRIVDVTYSGVKSVYTLRLTNGDVVTGSLDHQILTSEGWRTIGEIRDSSEGILVATQHGSTKRLGVVYSAVERVDYRGDEDVYDISVDGPNHNFIANNVVVHNCYNIQSGRYTEFEPMFYVPDVGRPLKNAGTSARPDLVSDPDIKYREVLFAHEDAFRGAWDAYTFMIDKGVANEVARNVLPAATYTTMYMTGNLRNWAHFLKLRNGSEGHPQGEIVTVANEIQYHLNRKFPVSMKYLMEDAT